MKFLFKRTDSRSGLLSCGLLALAFAGGLNAGFIPLRPLPITNVNEAAGADRSNISFTQQDPSQRLIGDFFALPDTSPLWLIDSISVWSVGSVLGEALGQEFNSVSLYGGVRSQADFGLIATGAPNTFFEPNSNTVLNSNPSIEHTQVQYSNGEDYEGVGSPGVFYPVWRNTFSNLNWFVPGGSIIDFSVWGTNPSPDANSLYGYWFVHMSNALQGGILQQNADGAFLVFDFANLHNPGFRANPEELGLWDKTADVNVVISAQAIPEPAYGLALVASLGILELVRRRRSRQ